MCLLEDNQPVCYCVPDYHGQLCELRYNDCESKFARCENGGTCVDGINSFMCSCPSPYTGEMCSIYNPDLITESHPMNTTEKTGEASARTTPLFTIPQTQVTEDQLDRQSTTEKFTELTSPISDNSTKFFTRSTSSRSIINETRTESSVVYETTTNKYTTSQLMTSLDYLSSTTEDNRDKTTAPETSTTVFQINDTTKFNKNFSTETSLNSFTKVPIIQLNATDLTSSSLPSSTMSTIKLTSWSSEINLTTELSSEDEISKTTSMPTILTSTKIINESFITFSIPTSSTIDLPLTIPTLSELTTDKSHITSTIMYSTETEGRSKSYNCTDDCIHVTPCTSGNSSQVSFKFNFIIYY